MSDPTTRSEKKQDLVVTRIFDAPIEQAWEAWVDPEIVMQWWGPNGFTSPSAKMDFRVGGTSLVCMRAPEEYGGQDLYNTWTYLEITPMKRFVYILRFSDKHGNVMNPADLGLPPETPEEVRNEVVFRDLGNGKTEVIVTEFDWTVGQMMEMSKMGLEQCLDKMAATLSKATKQRKPTAKGASGASGRSSRGEGR